MRSDSAPPAAGGGPEGPAADAAGAPARAGRLGWLRSQGLGLACGFATVVLLAVGSVVITATRDGASAGVRMDDLRGFFAPPSPVHLWLYLLLPVAALYALNTVLATWDTVTRRWRAGVRAPSAYAASLVHVGFLLGLVAHGVGGFFGEDGGEVLVASGWQPVPGFGEVRLVSLDVDRLPGGMPRSARAEVEVREGGAVRGAVVGYNAPLSGGAGARLALLSDMGQVPVARIAAGGAGCSLAEGQECLLGAARVRLLGFVGAPGGGPAALLSAPGPSGREEVRALPPGAEVPALGAGALRVDRIAREPVVVLRARAAPGNPWALAASFVTAAGLALMWRKLAR